MQYTSKIALLAVALFGTSALAVPFASDAGYDVEAREVDNDLSAREFYDMYLEARADPSLDARDLDSLDLEAREYLEYLEARATAAAELPQTPLSPHSPHLETTVHSHGAHETTHSESKPHPSVYLTPHQKAIRRAKIVAAKEFEDPKVYHAALTDKDNKLHRFAVSKYLSKPKNLRKALANTDSPYHKAAKRVLHQRKAKVYLADKSNLKKALKHKHNKYHKDAVKLYLSRGDNFEHALSNKKARFHKAAVHEYLLDTKTRKSVLADKTDPFFKQAKKLQKKINKELKHIKVSTGSAADKTTSTSSPGRKA
jgi:hypothetical protein